MSEILEQWEQLTHYQCDTLICKTIAELKSLKAENEKLRGFVNRQCDFIAGECEANRVLGCEWDDAIESALASARDALERARETL